MSRICRLFGAVGAIALLLAVAGCAPQRLTTALADVVPANATTAQIVTIGDSVMSGFTLADGDDWPTMLAADQDFTVANLACPGAGFVAVGDCDMDFAGLLSDASARTPRIVIIQSSSNDMDDPAPAVQTATMQTVQQLAQEMPDVQIIGLSTIWNDAEVVPPSITDSSDALRAAMEAVGGTYVDVGQPLQGQRDLLGPDDIHPTVQGQRVIAQAVARALAAAGVSLQD